MYLLTVTIVLFSFNWFADTIDRFYDPIGVFRLNFHDLGIVRVGLRADDAESRGEHHQAVEQTNHNHQEKYLRTSSYSLKYHDSHLL